MSRLNKNQSLLESAKDDLMKLIDNLPDNTEYIFTTNNKLKNKAYLKNAPKEIVQNDKKLVKELTVEDGKLRSIVSSIS